MKLNRLTSFKKSALHRRVGTHIQARVQSPPMITPIP
jgi:hypothetical protein